MTARDFIYWLRGYLSGIDKNTSIEEVIETISKKADEIDLPDSVVERIIEKETTPFINPHMPSQPVITMYGIQPDYYKESIPPYIITSSTHEKKDDKCK